MLEYVVRPFGSPGSQGKIIIPSTPVGTHEAATVTWGATGTIPPVQVAPGGSFSCCNDEKTEADDQKYETVTVTNEGSGDDAGQSVTFQRAKSFSYEAKQANGCASNWDQFSGVGMDVTGALAEFAADLTSGISGQDVPSNTCTGQMTLRNEAT